ncbi:MAG: ABC transporter ATP-binding protein, partial [Sporomusa sp.]
DEPTSGLDGDSVLKVGQWVRALAQTKKSIIIITHDRVLSELACGYMMELKKTEYPEKHAYSNCFGEQGVKESVFGKISDIKYLA